MNRRLLPIVAVLVFFVPTGTQAGIEDRDWCLTSTAHFDLVSDLPQDEALALLGSLDRFRSAASSLLPGSIATDLPPLKLLVFARSRDFGTTFNSTVLAGFARSSLSQSLLASGPDREGHHLHRNVFHEYTHYLLRSRAALNLPIWYEEGLASYLSTLSVDGTGLVVVGRVPYRYVRGAILAPGVSIMDVVGERFVLEVDHHEVSNVYGVAWALVRFLHHAEAPDGSRYADKLGAMLSAIDEGMSSIQAMRSIMGIDPAGLLLRLRKYYESDELPVYRFRTETVERLAFARRCLDGIEARYALAEAAAFRNWKFALDLYTQIIDSDPGHVGALVGLSKLVDAGQALEFAERAHESDPDDPRPVSAWRSFACSGVVAGARPGRRTGGFLRPGAAERDQTLWPSVGVARSCRSGRIRARNRKLGRGPVERRLALSARRPCTGSLVATDQLLPRRGLSPCGRFGEFPKAPPEDRLLASRGDLAQSRAPGNGVG